MLRILKNIALYVIVALLFTVFTVGVMNTYLGVDSPIRPTLERIVSALPPLPPIAEKFTGLRSKPSVVAAPSTTRDSTVIHAGGGAWHQSVGETASICGVPGVEEVPVWSERTAYTWVNEDGVRSFGDNAPSSAPAQAFGLDEGDRDFTLSLRWEGVSPNRTFEGRIRAGAMRVYDQWGEWIGYDALVRSRITLRITSNRDAFMRDWGGDPGGPMPNGFYSLTRNEAVVFYDAARTSEAKLLQVAFHELTHLISTWQVGPLPPWYGEGIAEYFETMDVEWQSARFRTADAWRQRVARDGAMRLSELLALNAAEWFSGDIGQRYATAGALMAFMNTTDAGRTALTGLAQQAHALRCKQRHEKQGLTPSGYPGGVVRLERDFRRWLMHSLNP